MQIGEVARTLSSAAFLQLHSARLDSVAVKSPLPGGVRQVVRFLLTTVPPWIQIGGLVLAIIVAAAIAWTLFRHRLTIINWILSRSTAIKVALALAAIVLVVGVAGAGTVTWNYTQHSNDFCTGCHVMDRAVDRMRGGPSKHAKLSCHACHQQPLSASMSQLYVWVSERPDRILKHANVPNQVCKTCHETQDTAAWQRIAATAGHRVHLESDSSALKNLKCVTCHGKELHRFEPANTTCAQSGCHDPNKIRIALGKMAGQTDLHCTSCHQFTADVPALATRDSARGTLVPGSQQCLACHKMQKLLADFDPTLDPHGGKCGTCHNPHTQKTPLEASTTCESCHSNWRDEPFHAGANHRRIAAKCLTCHVPHRARVDASDCQGCHQRMRNQKHLQPPMPFDTLKALRRAEAVETRPFALQRVKPPRPLMLASATVSNAVSISSRDAFKAMLDPPLTPVIASIGFDPPSDPVAPQDSFSHARHEKLACLVCHQTAIGKGSLTFERPRGCQICHHQAPSQARCASCHKTAELRAPIPATATVTVPGHAPRARTVEFKHTAHSARACLECHTTPVTMTPVPAKAECRACHDDHHAVARNCSTCHSPVEPLVTHKSVEPSHQRCDACHTSSTIAALTPDRNFCSTCHVEKAKNHYDAKECTTCHFLTEPAAFRSMLIKRPKE